MKILFYCRTSEPALLDLLEFYSGDIATLREAGHDVLVRTTAATALRERPDLIFAWWWHSSLPVIAAFAARGVPAICTGATDFRNPLLPRWKRQARRALTAGTLRLTKANLAISDFELNDLTRLRARGAQTMHLGIDTGFYRPGAATRTKASAVLIGQVNPLSIRRKGIDVAVAAASLIAQEVPDFRLSLVGPADSAGSAWLARSVRPGGPVVYLGRLTRNDKLLALQDAEIYMQPSEYEGFGLSVAEAMATGCVPAVSSAGSLPEVVGGVGVMVRPSDPAELAAAVVHLLKSTDLQEQGEAARRRGEAFDHAVRRDRLLSLVTAVARSR